MSWYIKCWKQYADFSGRARRMEYWMFTLFNTLATIVLYIPLVVIIGANAIGDPTATGEPEMSPMALLAFVPLMIYGLAVFIPSLAVTVRRLHDQDRSGWLFLIALIPFLGGLLMLIFMCLEGTSGQNRYGPDPLRRQGDDEVWPDVA